MSPALDASALFRRLHEADVRYVVVGGFAVVAHGVIRTTRDLDICPDPSLENLERLASLVGELDTVQVGADESAADALSEDEFPYDPTRPEELAQGGNFRLSTSLGKLDIMQWLPGIDADRAYETLAAEALTAEVEGIPVTVCSLQHLRAMKRAAGRPQDLEDLADLLTAHSS